MRRRGDRSKLAAPPCRRMSCFRCRANGRNWRTTEAVAVCRFLANRRRRHIDCACVFVPPSTAGYECPMTQLADHYPNPAAMRADLVVHIIGLTFAVLGGAILLVLAFRLDPLRQAASVSIYVAGLVAMLA